MEQERNTEIEVEDNKIDETEATNEGTVESGKTPKLFTEAEVESIIKSRLSRRKSDIQAIESDYKSQLDTADVRIKELEGLVSSFIESETRTFDPSIIALLEKLDVLERVEWIKQNKGKTRRELPETPKGKSNGEKTVYKPVKGSLF